MCTDTILLTVITLSDTLIFGWGPLRVQVFSFKSYAPFGEGIYQPEKQTLF